MMMAKAKTITIVTGVIVWLILSFCISRQAELLGVSDATDKRPGIITGPVIQRKAGFDSPGLLVCAQTQSLTVTGYYRGFPAVTLASEDNENCSADSIVHYEKIYPFGIVLDAVVSIMVVYGMYKAIRMTTKKRGERV
jgi:hypothetical protein